MKKPLEIAEIYEMTAQMVSDEGDKELAADHMEIAHTIRRLLKTLERLNLRVHSNYDFNSDPDKMTLEVGELLGGESIFADQSDADLASLRRDREQLTELLTDLAQCAFHVQCALLDEEEAAGDALESSWARAQKYLLARGPGSSEGKTS